MSDRTKVVKLALETVTVGANLAVIAMVIYYWPLLPERIPVHFNYLGRVDGWGGKAMLIFIAATAGFVWFCLTMAKRSKSVNVPWKITEENKAATLELAAELFLCLKAEIAFMFCYLVQGIVNCALSKKSGLDPAFLPIFLITVFGTIGVFYFRGWRKFMTIET